MSSWPYKLPGGNFWFKTDLNLNYCVKYLFLCVSQPHEVSVSPSNSMTDPSGKGEELDVKQHLWLLQ